LRSFLECLSLGRCYCCSTGLGLRDEANSWLIAHVGSVLFVGLMGAALYLLVRETSGLAARISSPAIGPFVLFYAAGEAIRGVATGVVVEHANDVPAGQREAAADAAQACTTPVRVKC
jgi:hypothetical protein